MAISDGKIELGGKYLLTLKSYHLNPDFARSSFHFHRELEISCVKSGSGVYLLDGKKYEIHNGDVFIFNNIEHHTICSISPGELLINNVILFDPRFIWSIGDSMFDYRFLQIFFNRNQSFENRLVHNNPISKEIHRLFSEIEYEFASKLPEYQLIIKVKLLNILAALTRHYSSSETNNEDYSKRREALSTIDKVIDYMNENLSNEIKLEELAEIAHMNSAYFSTFFKKYIGMSPFDYLSKCRIYKAVEYLQASSKTILEIATLCGFNSTAGFNKAFKKVLGKVPKMIRKSRA